MPVDALTSTHDVSNDACARHPGYEKSMLHGPVEGGGGPGAIFDTGGGAGNGTGAEGGDGTE